MIARDDIISTASTDTLPLSPLNAQIFDYEPATRLTANGSAAQQLVK